MFEFNLSFEDTQEWEDSLDRKEADGKLKFPVTFHDTIPPIEEIEDHLTLSPPRKKETKVKVVELKKKNDKTKKGLF